MHPDGLKACRVSLCAALMLGSALFAQNPAGALAAVPDALKDSSRSHSPEASASARSDLRLGAGDLLDLKVYGAPELSNTVRISDAGEITVPLIGAVTVSGLTAEESQKRIEERLLSGGFLRD